MKPFVSKVTPISGRQLDVVYEMREDDGVTVVETNTIRVRTLSELQSYLRNRASEFTVIKGEIIDVGEVDISPIVPTPPTQEELDAQAFRKDLSLLMTMHSAQAAGVDIKTDATDLAADLSGRYAKGILG